MFYLETNEITPIYINRTFIETDVYTLTFKHKDEFNTSYSMDLLPSGSNERYSTFFIDLVSGSLKPGSYKLYIYDDTEELQYNDVCYVNLSDDETEVQYPEQTKTAITY